MSIIVWWGYAEQLKSLRDCIPINVPGTGEEYYLIDQVADRRLLHYYYQRTITINQRTNTTIHKQQ